MGTGTYGHASAILLKGQEKAAATRAKKKREKEFAETTPEIMQAQHLHYATLVCPACFKHNQKETCLHRHKEDNELYEIKTIPMEFVCMVPGSAQKFYDQLIASEQTL